MALVNRDKDVSEQQLEYQIAIQNITTGLTLIVGNVPYPCSVQDIRFEALGTSGSPTANFEVHRFIVGTGATQITGLMQAAITLQALGTSGPQRASLAVAGSTLLLLQANDVLVWKSGGANSAALSASATIVVKALQDIKSYFGL